MTQPVQPSSRSETPSQLEPNPARVSERTSRGGLNGPTVELTGAPEQLVLDLRIPGSTSFEAHGGLIAASRWQRTAKRTLDVVVALVTLALLAPLFAVVSLLIFSTSPGHVLYFQDRVGENGKIFRFCKFRTMQLGAAELKLSLHTHNEADGPVFKIREDPRVTKVGRILRKLSIDELPQLLHVLRGEMSLVGPRPHLVHEVEEYTEWEKQRLRVKPGITCIWQVSGRAELDFETWIQMDIEYIRQWTPWLDVKLLARTVPAVLSTRGAY